MAILRATSTAAPQWHYARLLITPTPFSAAQAELQPIDRIGFLQLCAKTLAEWFGAAGGLSGADVDVISVQPSSLTSLPHAQAARELLLRFPSLTAHPFLTALPLTNSSHDGQNYEVRVLADSADLKDLGGQAGRGKEGYKAWVTALKGE